MLFIERGLTFNSILLHRNSFDSIWRYFFALCLFLVLFCFIYTSCCMCAMCVLCKSFSSNTITKLLLNFLVPFFFLGRHNSHHMSSSFLLSNVYTRSHTFSKWIKKFKKCDCKYCNRKLLLSLWFNSLWGW